MLCAFGACVRVAGAGLFFQAGQFSGFFVYDRHIRARNVHRSPILQRPVSVFFAVLCGAVLVDASAWARRASQWRPMRAGPRGSADSFLDGRLAGTGPSAHRVDSGPIGLRALLSM